LLGYWQIKLPRKVISTRLGLFRPQCGTHPKIKHSQAVKRIGRYLLGTKDKGMILTPDLNHSLEVFADADFCGLHEDPEMAIYDPITAKSRTGYIIKYMGCPSIPLWRVHVHIICHAKCKRQQVCIDSSWPAVFFVVYKHSLC
jgi:hypothetical protein